MSPFRPKPVYRKPVLLRVPDGYVPVPEVARMCGYKNAKRASEYLVEAGVNYVLVRGLNVAGRTHVVRYFDLAHAIRVVGTDPKRRASRGLRALTAREGLRESDDKKVREIIATVVAERQAEKRARATRDQLRRLRRSECPKLEQLATERIWPLLNHDDEEPG